MVKALASHQCGLGSNPGFNAMYGLSFLLVFSICHFVKRVKFCLYYSITVYYVYTKIKTFIPGSFIITVLGTLLPAFCLKMNLNFPITVSYNDLRFVIRQSVDSTSENQRSV